MTATAAERSSDQFMVGGACSVPRGCRSHGRREGRAMTASSGFGSVTEPGLSPEVERLLLVVEDGFVRYAVARCGTRANPTAIAADPPPCAAPADDPASPTSNGHRTRRPAGHRDTARAIDRIPHQ